jgi:hypothetical protein
MKRIPLLFAALALVFSLVACDSSQPSGWRPSRRTGTQTLVYVVQPHANASLDRAFQRAANTWSWNAHLEVRMVRSCPAARTCIHVQLGNAWPNLAYFQILDGSGLAQFQWHTARIVMQWPWPAGQNLDFVACHEVGHGWLRHGDHYEGNGYDGPCDYSQNYPTDIDQRNTDAVFSHPNDAVGSPGV